jgi:hypothetical protein
MDLFAGPETAAGPPDGAGAEPAGWSGNVQLGTGIARADAEPGVITLVTV